MIPVPATQTQADMWSELDGGRGNKSYVIGGPEDGDDETMDEDEWSEWRESLVDPEVERTRPAPGQYDIFGGVVEA